MSYDLFVFDPKAAPKDHEAFIDWATAEMEREDGVTDGDPALTSSGLRAWFLGMIPHFPAMNGPFAPETLPDDQNTLTDYSITAGSIYVGFRWSKNQSARKKAFELVERYDLGLYDLGSTKEEVYLLNDRGRLTVAHQQRRTGMLERLRRTSRRLG